MSREKALRDAMGLGGPGVEGSPSFNLWTLDQARSTIKALNAYGFDVVPLDHYMGDDCTEEDGAHLDWMERSRETVPA